MSIISTVSSYVEKHEKMVLLAIAGLVLWFGIGKIDTLIANHDNANLQQAKVAAQIQADKVAAVAEQVQQQAQQYQILATKLDAQNAALVAANTQLATALAQRQKTDATLPPSGLAERWRQLVPQVTTSDVSAGQMTVNTPGVSATVQQLEQVPVLSTQLGNERTQLGNTQALLTAEGQQVTTLNTEVGSLRIQITDNAKVCDARVKVETDKIHKARRRWFVIGYVAGFLSRQYIKTSTGM